MSPELEEASPESVPTSVSKMSLLKKTSGLKSGSQSLGWSAVMLLGRYTGKHRNLQWDTALPTQRSSAKLSHACWAPLQMEGRCLLAASWLWAPWTSTQGWQIGRRKPMSSGAAAESHQDTLWHPKHDHVWTLESHPINCTEYPHWL